MIQLKLQPDVMQPPSPDACSAMSPTKRPVVVHRQGQEHGLAAGSSMAEQEAVLQVCFTSCLAATAIDGRLQQLPRDCPMQSQLMAAVAPGLGPRQPLEDQCPGLMGRQTSAYEA